MKTVLYTLIVSLLPFVCPTYASDEALSNAGSSVLLEQSITKINLNTADVSTLIRSIKGIGKKRAAAIVNYRETHGPFKSIEELANVRGIGQSFLIKHLAKLQQIFTVE